MGYNLLFWYKKTSLDCHSQDRRLLGFPRISGSLVCCGVFFKVSVRYSEGPVCPIPYMSLSVWLTHPPGLTLQG